MDSYLIEFNVMGDERGSLVALEANKNIPFDIKRVFYIYGTTNDVPRGQHANKFSKQVLLCISGSCKVLVDNGNEKQTIIVDQPNKGLYIGNMIWREMFDFSDDCIIMILTSEYYDKTEYFNDYDEFLKVVCP